MYLLVYTYTTFYYRDLSKVYTDLSTFKILHLHMQLFNTGNYNREFQTHAKAYACNSSIWEMETEG